jgi:hypothetical protein
MKMYWGSGSIASRLLNFGSRWRWVASFADRPLYNGAHWLGGWVGPRVGLHIWISAPLFPEKREPCLCAVSDLFVPPTKERQHQWTCSERLHVPVFALVGCQAPEHTSLSRALHKMFVEVIMLDALCSWPRAADIAPCDGHIEEQVGLRFSTVRPMELFLIILLRRLLLHLIQNFLSPPPSLRHHPFYFFTSIFVSSLSFPSSCLSLIHHLPVFSELFLLHLLRALLSPSSGIFLILVLHVHLCLF